MMSPSTYNHRRSGHTLTELVVAMVASSALLAGLGSVMMIARQVACTPSAANLRIEAAEVVNQISEELRYATFVLNSNSQTLEFVVADRNGDSIGEKIRYEWSGVAGDPLYKTLNASTSVVAANVRDCNFSHESSNLTLVPFVRTCMTHELVRLQLGSAGHSRVEASIPLLTRPERLAAYWRTDFNPGVNPTSAVDVDANGSADWVASNGATFSVAVLNGGMWTANGDLATSPANDFTGNTIVEARCRNMAAAGSVDVLRINADRQSGSYAPLIVRMTKQADGSQSLTLLGKPTSTTEQTLRNIDHLADDFVRFRLTIRADTNQVGLRIHDVGEDVLGGPFIYPTHPASGTDRCVKIGGGARFDYVDVRVLSGA